MWMLLKCVHLGGLNVIWPCFGCDGDMDDYTREILNPEPVKPTCNRPEDRKNQREQKHILLKQTTMIIYF